MPYIVDVNPVSPTDGRARFEARTRKDALEKATGLQGQGLQNVTITDENGRVYGPKEFDKFFLAGDD
jgi:hypothetical protein